MRRLLVRGACCAVIVLLLTGAWVSDAAPPTARAPTAPAVEALINEAYELMYNLDHDAALSKLQLAIERAPEHPAGYRGVAFAAWLRALFLRGAVLVDSQLNASLRGSRAAEPPPELSELFHRNVARAIELSEARVKHNTNDPDALYELGASVAMAASYQASVDNEPLKALEDAKRAYDAHRKVLERDPARHDAALTVGIYRYLVSIMPRVVRMMAYVVGFDGGKTEAIELVKRTVDNPGTTQAEAMFALVLMYNREKEFADAQRVLYALKQRFPRNRLIWLESASTWLRDDQPKMAEVELRDGFAKLAEDQRTRMYGEDAIWRLKRGTTYVALGRGEGARADLETARDADAPAWVQGRARVELGKLADLQGDRSGARREYDAGRKLCNRAGDSRCARLADKLKRDRYTGNAPGDQPVSGAVR